MWASPRRCLKQGPATRPFQFQASSRIPAPMRWGASRRLGTAAQLPCMTGTATVHRSASRERPAHDEHAISSAGASPIRNWRRSSRWIFGTRIVSGRVSTLGPSQAGIPLPPSTLVVHRTQKNKNRLGKSRVSGGRGEISNSREACTSAGFQDRCLKPLGHPSSLPWNFLQRECSAKSAGYWRRPRKRSVIKGLYTFTGFYHKAAHGRIG